MSIILLMLRHGPPLLAAGTLAYQERNGLGSVHPRLRWTRSQMLYVALHPFVCYLHWQRTASDAGCRHNLHFRRFFLSNIRLLDQPAEHRAEILVLLRPWLRVKHSTVRSVLLTVECDGCCQLMVCSPGSRKATTLATNFTLHIFAHRLILWRFVFCVLYFASYIANFELSGQIPR